MINPEVLPSIQQSGPNFNNTNIENYKDANNMFSNNNIHYLSTIHPMNNFAQINNSVNSVNINDRHIEDYGNKNISTGPEFNTINNEKKRHRPAIKVFNSRNNNDNDDKPEKKKDVSNKVRMRLVKNNKIVIVYVDQATADRMLKDVLLVLTKSMKNMRYCMMIVKM